MLLSITPREFATILAALRYPSMSGTPTATAEAAGSNPGQPSG
jgi:hypothetical protein